MEQKIEYIKSFLNKYNYPLECIEGVLNVIKNLVLRGNFQDLIEICDRYKIDYTPSYKDIFDSVDELSQKSGVHIYSLNLLVFILMSETLKRRYETLEYPEEIFNNSMLDIKYKVFECKLVKGIWGNFVPTWEYGFFSFILYGFNHLQFELFTLYKNVEVDGAIIKKGTKILSTHIPRTKKHLYEDEVDQDFASAMKFFKGKVDNETIFYCHSWLLYPINKEILSKESNLYKFIDRFTLIDSDIAKDYSEMWRLFDKEIDINNIDDLPNDTSFRRSYINMIKNNVPIGHGEGIYIIKDNKEVK